MPSMLPATRLLSALAAAALLAGCALPAPTRSAQASGNNWNEPSTGSLIGGVDGGADQNSNSPSLGSKGANASATGNSR